MFLIFPFVGLGLPLPCALPCSPPYQANLNTSTSDSLSSTSHGQAASTEAPSINLASRQLLAATKPIATNHTIPSQPTFPTESQPQWSPGDIGTVVFGCIASILGVLALYLTLWLGRRGPGVPARYGMYCMLSLNAGTTYTADFLLGQTLKATPASPTSRHPTIETCHSNSSRLT